MELTPAIYVFKQILSDKLSVACQLFSMSSLPRLATYFGDERVVCIVINISTLRCSLNSTIRNFAAGLKLETFLSHETNLTLKLLSWSHELHWCRWALRCVTLLIFRIHFMQCLLKKIAPCHLRFVKLIINSCLACRTLFNCAISLRTAICVQKIHFEPEEIQHARLVIQNLPFIPLLSRQLPIVLPGEILNHS